MAMISAALRFSLPGIVSVVNKPVVRKYIATVGKAALISMQEQVYEDMAKHIAKAISKNNSKLIKEIAKHTKRK